MGVGTSREDSVILKRRAQQFSSMITKRKDQDPLKCTESEIEPQYRSYVIPRFDIVKTLVRNKIGTC